MPAALQATELLSTLPSFRVSVGLSRSHTTFEATNCGLSVEPKDRQKLAGRLRMRVRAAHGGR